LIRWPPEYNSLDLNLNKFTGCIGEVIDTSRISGTLNAIYQINGFPPCTTVVDTGTNGLYNYYDVHTPFDTTLALQGRQGNIRLEKKVGNTAYWTDVPFTVDRTRFDAQLIRDTAIYFPQNVSGVEQQGTERQRKGLEFRVWPSVTQGRVNVAGTKGFDAYNVAGRKVGEYHGNNTNSTGTFNFSSYPSGVYFLRPEDMNQKTKKVVKIE
jgi:hypothetical protein